jgi:hypothetical protein
MALKIELQVDDKGTATVKSFSNTAKKEIQGIESQTKSSTSAMSASWSKLAGVVAGVFSAQKIGSFFTDLFKYVDQLNNFSAQLGVSSSELDRWRKVLEGADIDLNTLVRSFQIVNKNVQDASRGVGKASYLFEALGLSVSKLSKMNVSDQFIEIAGAINKVSDPTTKLYLAQELLSIRSTELLRILPGLRDRFNETKSAVSEELSRNVEEFDNRLKSLWNTIKDSGLSGLNEGLKVANRNFGLLIENFVVLGAIGASILGGKILGSLSSMAGLTANATREMKHYLPYIDEATGKFTKGIPVIEKYTDTSRWIKFGNALRWAFGAIAAGAIGYEIGQWLNSIKGFQKGVSDVIGSIHVGFVWLVGQVEILFVKLEDAWNDVIFKIKEAFWSGLRSMWDGVPNWVKSFLGMGEFNLSAPEKLAGQQDKLKIKQEELNKKIAETKKMWDEIGDIAEESVNPTKKETTPTTPSGEGTKNFSLMSEEDLDLLKKYTKEAQDSLKQLTPLEEKLLVIDAELIRMDQDRNRNMRDETRETIKTLRELDIEYLRAVGKDREADLKALQQWYEDQLELHKNNAEAKKKIDEIYQAKKRELEDENLKVLRDLSDMTKDRLTDAMAEIIMGTKSIKEAFKDLLTYLANEFLKAGLKKIIDQIMGQSATGSGGWLGTIFSLLSSAYSGGGGAAASGMTAGQAAGVASGAFSIATAQHGGPVSAYKPYMVGEAGPELFMPRTSGSIIPNDQLGKGGGRDIVINNTVNVNNSGGSGKTDPKDVERTGRIYKKMLKDAVKEVLMEEQRPMGMLNKGYA